MTTTAHDTLPDALFRSVSGRGTPPADFLRELIAWGRSAPESIFAPNSNPLDIYALVRPKLGPAKGPWTDLLDRRAAMLEAMRVHAGYESSWRWSEGVDTTNRQSLTHIAGQETGIFQVSYDSTGLTKSMLDFARANGLDTPGEFIRRMKEDHSLAMTYYALLVRVSIRWAGPLIRREILPDLSREAMGAFREMLV